MKYLNVFVNTKKVISMESEAGSLEKPRSLRSTHDKRSLKFHLGNLIQQYLRKTIFKKYSCLPH